MRIFFDFKPQFMFSGGASTTSDKFDNIEYFLDTKMRFISAPWLGLLETGAWLKNARHANQCAEYLENQLLNLEGVEMMFPREANAVFVKLPQRVITSLQEKNWLFYTFIGVGGVRFMCSWNTTQARIDELVHDIKVAIIS